MKSYLKRHCRYKIIISNIKYVGKYLLNYTWVVMKRNIIQVLKRSRGFVSKLDSKTYSTTSKIDKNIFLKETKIELNDKIRNITMSSLTNILIKSDDRDSENSLESIFKKVLDGDRYTFYKIGNETLEKGAWKGRTALLTITGNVNPSIVQEHFLQGGKILGLHTNLLETIIPYYNSDNRIDTAEFKYDKFNVKVKYETVGCKHMKKEFVYKHQGGNELEVEVLVSEKNTNTPLLIKVTDLTNNGIALFSQAYLESLLEDQANECTGIFTKILKDVLNLHVKYVETEIEYTKGYFLGDFEDKMNLIKSLCKEDNFKHTSQDDLKIQWCVNDERPIEKPSKTFIPIYVGDNPEHFNVKEYYGNLTSKKLGHLLIYSDVLTTTMDIIKETLTHGIAVTAKRQLLGKGRGDNAWITPPGQAAISLQLWLKISPTISLIQHAAALAAVLAIRKYCEDLNIRIKWPNDIYYGRHVKIGGVITTANCIGDDVIVNIGTGVNISNNVPTVSVNDIIKKYNEKNGTNSPEISIEAFLGRYCSELEFLFDYLEKGGDDFLKLYYKYWLHDDEDIKVQIKDQSEIVKGKISGVDSAGWLCVKTEFGEITVAPDGNSFDMMNGLVAPKI